MRFMNPLQLFSDEFKRLCQKQKLSVNMVLCEIFNVTFVFSESILCYKIMAMEK